MVGSTQVDFKNMATLQYTTDVDTLRKAAVGSMQISRIDFISRALALSQAVAELIAHADPRLVDSARLAVIVKEQHVAFSFYISSNTEILWSLNGPGWPDANEAPAPRDAVSQLLENIRNTTSTHLEEDTKKCLAVMPPLISRMVLGLRAQIMVSTHG